MPAIVPKVNTASVKNNTHAGISASMPNFMTKPSQIIPTIRMASAFNTLFNFILLAMGIIKRLRKACQPRQKRT